MLGNTIVQSHHQHLELVERVFTRGVLGILRGEKN
jgi:hypothetical protein